MGPIGGGGEPVHGARHPEAARVSHTGTIWSPLVQGGIVPALSQGPTRWWALWRGFLCSNLGQSGALTCTAGKQAQPQWCPPSSSWGTAQLVSAFTLSSLSFSLSASQ